MFTHNEKSWLFGRIKKRKLQLQPDMCEFLRKEVPFLGHIITKGNVKVHYKIVEAVTKFSKPSTPTPTFHITPSHTNS
jgi:hypothetical protein